MELWELYTEYENYGLLLQQQSLLYEGYNMRPEELHSEELYDMYCLANTRTIMWVNNVVHTQEK